MLPRLFNLCRMAQGAAARLALRLTVGSDDPAGMVLRDRLVQDCVIQRHAFGLAPLLADPAAMLGAGLPWNLATFLVR